MQKITPNFWFNRNAAEAVELYTSIFPDARINKTTYYRKEGYEFHQMPGGTVLTIEFELYGESFVALNGGPMFQLNPSVSLMAICDTEEELNELWNKLSEGGKVLMALDKYDWSPRYGWCNDRYGVSWQLYLSDDASYTGQKIVPTLLFTGDKCGKAEEAVHFYTTVFEDSEIDGILKYEAGDQDKEGLVKHSQFVIRDYTLAAMDSSADHHFTFSEAMSFIVHCNTQEEVDRYWNTLIADGGEESQCGWLKDKYGLSWQIIPQQLYNLLDQKDKARASNVMNAMLRMRKLVIADLEAASR